MEINRRQVLSGTIGLGVGGLLFAISKSGMSSLIPTCKIPGDFVKVPDWNSRVPINLTVIETNKTEYKLDIAKWPDHPFVVQFYKPNRCGNIFDPAYELYHFITQCIEHKIKESNPLDKEVKWFLFTNSDKEMVGICCGLGLSIPDTPLNTMICDGKWRESYIESIHFYPSYKWWDIGTRRREF